MLEDIGVRAVIDNLSGFVAGQNTMQKSINDTVQSLDNLSMSAEESVKAIYAMRTSATPSIDALRSMQRATGDETDDLVTMTGAIHGTRSGWDKFKISMDATMESVRQHKVILASFGAAIVGTLGLMVKGAEAQRLSQAKLSVALGNVGVSYAAVRKELEATMAATFRKTGVSDEEQRAALSELVFTTGNYEKALSALPVVLDLAAAKGMDASSAARILGRAMTGSTDMLKRYGIYVKEGASATEILATVQRSVAGSAEAMASPFAIMKDQIGEMGESIGTVLLPPLKLFTRIVVEAVNVIRWFVEHTGFLGKGLVYLTGVIGLGTVALVAYAMAMKSGIIHETLIIASKAAHAVSQWAVNAALAAGIAPATGFAIAVNLGIWPLTLIAAAIAAVIAGIVLLIKYWDKIIGIFRSTPKAAKEAEDSVSALNKEIADLTAEQARLTEEQEAAQEELKILQDEYTHVEENAAGYRDEIKRLNTAIDSNKDRMDELSDAISDVNAELDDLAHPNLEGMQEFDDQIFSVEQEIKKLKLRELTEGIDLSVQIEGLEKTKEQLELTRDITFDPLERSATEAVETIKGLNDEIAPSSVLSRIKELGTNLTSYTTEYDTLNTETNKLTGTLDNIMTVVNNQLGVMSEHLLDLKNKIYDLGVAFRENETTLALKEEEANKPIIHLEPPEPVEVKGIWNMEENPEMSGLFGQKSTATPTGLFGQTITVDEVNVTVPDINLATGLPEVDEIISFPELLRQAFEKLQGGAQFGGYFPQMQPVRVGERGPEVVMIPAGSTVMPNQYNTTNYNVNAHYANAQTPQGIGMDLEAIRLLSRV